MDQSITQLSENKSPNKKSLIIMFIVGVTLLCLFSFIYYNQQQHINKLETEIKKTAISPTVVKPTVEAASAMQIDADETEVIKPTFIPTSSKLQETAEQCRGRVSKESEKECQDEQNFHPPALHGYEAESNYINSLSEEERKEFYDKSNKLSACFTEKNREKVKECEE